mgnify:FL=1|jgi:hypothetical protein
MFEYLAVIILVGVSLFPLLIRRIKGLQRRERWILLLYVLPIVYLSVIFATGNDWPNLQDLANLSIGKLADILVAWLKKHP